MNDPRVNQLADMLVNYSINVQPGEKVVIRSWTPAEPLLNAVYAKILEAGGYPHLLLKFSETEAGQTRRTVDILGHRGQDLSPSSGHGGPLA